MSFTVEMWCCWCRGVGAASGERSVGVLGEQSRDTALLCLHNCPLLGDLEAWSHWNLVFKPQHGDLKDFVQKYGKLHNMTHTGTYQLHNITIASIYKLHKMAQIGIYLKFV